MFWPFKVFLAVGCDVCALGEIGCRLLLTFSAHGGSRPLQRRTFRSHIGFNAKRLMGLAVTGNAAKRVADLFAFLPEGQSWCGR